MSHMLPDIQTLKPVIIIAFPLVYVAIVLTVDKMLVTGISKETMENWHANPSYWKSDAIYLNPCRPQAVASKEGQGYGVDHQYCESMVGSFAALPYCNDSSGRAFVIAF
jgi:hypothetical protein